MKHGGVNPGLNNNNMDALGNDLQIDDMCHSPDLDESNLDLSQDLNSRIPDISSSIHHTNIGGGVARSEDIHGQTAAHVPHQSAVAVDGAANTTPSANDTSSSVYSNNSTVKTESQKHTSIPHHHQPQSQQHPRNYDLSSPSATSPQQPGTLGHTSAPSSEHPANNSMSPGSSASPASTWSSADPNHPHHHHLAGHMATAFPHYPSMYNSAEAYMGQGHLSHQSYYGSYYGGQGQMMSYGTGNYL